MRAIVYRHFGTPDVLKTEEVAKPAPADDEVLVAVRAAAVNTFDEAGAVIPVIDRSYALKETAHAVRYVAAGHTRGKVIIEIGG